MDAPDAEAPERPQPPPGGLDWALNLCAILSVASFAGLLWLVLVRFAPSLPAPSPWLRAAIVVFASGGIGFGTNWLAIKMLFRPRRRIPWLLPWPQGLLPREQKRLAAALARVVSERLLHADAIADALDDERLRARVGEALREELDAFLREPETRRTLATLFAGGLRVHGPEIVHRLRPALRSLIERGIDEHITAERILGWMRGAVHRFSQNDDMRRSLARWIFRQTASDGVMAQVMAILRERFFRYRERNPIRGFLAEQFVIDWEDLRAGLVEALKSEESTEDLARILLDAAAALTERLGEEDTAHVVASVRRTLADRVLDWIEDEAVPMLAAKMGDLADSPDAWRAAEAAIDEVLTRVPDALFDPATGHLRPAVRERLRALQAKMVAAMPVAQIVERQVLAMDPVAIEAMVDEIGRRELAAIQILGMVLGIAAGVMLLAIM